VLEGPIVAGPPCVTFEMHQWPSDNTELLGTTLLCSTAPAGGGPGGVVGQLVPLAQRTSSMSQDLVRSSIEWLQHNFQQVSGERVA
jgi:hypothetical protein